MSGISAHTPRSELTGLARLCSVLDGERVSASRIPILCSAIYGGSGCLATDLTPHSCGLYVRDKRLSHEPV